MTMRDFDKLTHEQQKAMLIAVQVRNALEQFHAANAPDHFIDDEQMAKLNPVIRQAIFDALLILEDRTYAPRRERQLDGLLAGVPPYWGPPVKRPRDPRFEIFDD